MHKAVARCCPSTTHRFGFCASLGPRATVTSWLFHKSKLPTGYPSHNDSAKSRTCVAFHTNPVEILECSKYDSLRRQQVPLSLQMRMPSIFLSTDFAAHSFIH